MNGMALDECDDLALIANKYNIVDYQKVFTFNVLPQTSKDEQ